MNQEIGLALLEARRAVAKRRFPWGRLVWWIIFLVAAVFGIYALYMGMLEILARAGLVAGAPQRAVSSAFILHALSGGVVLIIGPLQFKRSWRARRPGLHRMLGRVYVFFVWIASASGLWSAFFFAQGAAQITFTLAALLWLAATTVAFQRAATQQFKAHRVWMIRSFALSLFFVTFPIWVEGLAATILPADVGYPLGVFLGWSVNLMVAEWWIHRQRGQVW